MTVEASSEFRHQTKIIDTLKQMEQELVLLKSTSSSSKTLVTSEYIDASATGLISQINVLLEEINYLFEFSNCQRLMLSDNTEHIKQLEMQLKELTLRKP